MHSQEESKKSEGDAELLFVLTPSFKADRLKGACSYFQNMNTNRSLWPMSPNIKIALTVARLT